MARKANRNGSPAVDASLKVEATTSARYSRERKITQLIPADVTRANAGAWLDLISPITQWAALKGDALRTA